MNTYKTKKKIPLNIGVLAFGVIFLYLIVTILLYLTSPHVISYEVREGNILKEYAYTGLALREETVVQAESSGYVNYYLSEGSKAAAYSNMYMISRDEVETAELGVDAQMQEITEKDLNQIILKTQKFNEAFQSEKFSDTYNLKTGIASVMLGIQNQNQVNGLDAMIGSGAVPDGKAFPAPKDGIVVYSVDGMEGLTQKDLNVDLLNKTNYQKTDFFNNQQVEKGNPVCKLVTSEKWSVAIETDKALADTLSKTDYVKVRFLKDDEYVNGSVSVMSRDEHYFAVISFQTAMVRYASERYLEMELILEDETGLKIPKTAQVEKEFFVVPKEYITEDANTREPGVMRRKKNGSDEFVKTGVYGQKDEMCYIASDSLKKGDILSDVENGGTTVVEKRGKLKGVYNINRGYAVFRQVNILAESGEYYIVEENTPYGLSNYDHIALDGKTIKENQVVFR